MSCFNNLHQIGIGLQNYHFAYQCFPPGGIEHRMMINPKTNKRYGKSGRQLAWSALLLPFIEQESLYRQLDLSKAFDAAENARAAAAIVPLYICPSEPQGCQLREERGPCHYGGIYGEKIVGKNDPPTGAMIYDRAISIAEITDGTSNTLIVAEDTSFLDGQWINGLNVFDQTCAINRAASSENDIRSEHPGGANGAFCDGSARFLTETMDLRTLAALCTIAGNETAASFD